MDYVENLTPKLTGGEAVRVERMLGATIGSALLTLPLALAKCDSELRYGQPQLAN